MHRRIKILEHSHFERERLFACLCSLLTTTTTTTRSFTRPTYSAVVSAPFFHFSLSTRPPSVQNSSLLEHTQHTPKRRFSLERERERGPFFLPKAFGRCCCTRRRRTLETLSSSEALFAFSFSVKERKRERIIIKWRLATLLRGRIPRTMMERRLYP
jgi:hypothetical protein